MQMVGCWLDPECSPPRPSSNTGFNKITDVSVLELFSSLPDNQSCDCCTHNIPWAVFIAGIKSSDACRCMEVTYLAEYIRSAFCLHAFGRHNKQYFAFFFSYEVDSTDNLDGKWQLKVVSVLGTSKKDARGGWLWGSLSLVLRDGLVFVKRTRKSGTDLLGGGCSVCSGPEVSEDRVQHVGGALSTGTAWAELGSGS